MQGASPVCEVVKVEPENNFYLHRPFRYSWKNVYWQMFRQYSCTGERSEEFFSTATFDSTPSYQLITTMFLPVRLHPYCMVR